MRISERMRWCVLGAALFVAACDDLSGLAGSQGATQAALFGGAVQAAGPEGYCIDRQASQLRSGFVVMAACPVISATTALPDTLGLITLQIGEAGTAAVSGSEAELAALLNTDAGAALLVSGEGSRRGDVERSAGVVLAYVEDTAASPLGAVEEGRWRGFTDVAGRLTTVTAYGLDAVPLSERRKLRLLRATIAALQAANPAAAIVAEADPA